MNPHPNLDGSRAMHRRSSLSTLIPVGVIVCMTAIIAWSAWPLLRPARFIKIEQVILASGLQTNDQTEATPTVATQPEAKPTNNEALKTTRVVQAAGWLEAEPYLLPAAALTNGVIQEMLILEGDQVNKDQPLARMVAQDAKLLLNQAQASFQIAQAGVAIAQARLVAAEQSWSDPFELQRAIDSNQAQLDGFRAQLNQLPSLIRTEQALLIQAQEELNRTESAYQKNAASEIEFIKARETVNAQDARLQATKARESILNASIEQTRAHLNASIRALELRIDDREQLEIARAQTLLAESELAHRAALLEEAQLELDRMTIRSPITGFVQRRLKAPGDKVYLTMDDPHSAHIAHIYDPSKLQVRVDVPLADASQVFKGQRCEVIVEVLPDRVFQGEVLIVTHEADLQKNTLQIKVRVIDPDPILRPEMLTRVKFLPNQSASQPQTSESTTVRLPASALDTTNSTERVWMVTQRQSGQGILQPIRVSRVNERDGWVTLSGDLQPGAMVAADPSQCTQGERVRFIPKKGDES